ncbi:MAG: hypothetical protein IIW46_00370, partial [Bacteroidaceae bacterium]|nr:hypothetical protein [Bacteroidaceae bacterium]
GNVFCAIDKDFFSKRRVRVRYEHAKQVRDVCVMLVRHTPTPNGKKYTFQKMRIFLTNVLGKIESKNENRLGL